jgi:protein-L-isoaspartate O-methyltransferase
MTYSTYSPDDNKLRIYPGSRLDAETYARVKAAGFSWAPKQECFYAQSWSPEREDLARELATDHEIEDEDRRLMDRATERAERFEGYQESRARDAEHAHKAVESIAGRFEFGQPILIGHHSEKKARKDQERMHAGMSRAVKAFETAEYWKHRAAAALAHAEYKESPAVRARRIKTIEAERRKVERMIQDAKDTAKAYELIDQPEKWKTREDGTETTREARALSIAGRFNLYTNHPNRTGFYWSAYDVLQPDGERYQGCPSVPIDEIIETARRRVVQAEARAARWLQHYDHRLAYERAMLAETGGAVAEFVNGERSIAVGGSVKIGSEWCTVLRVNKKDGRTVSVRTTRRYVPIVGIEEVSEYREPTEEQAAKVATAMKKPPLCNYPGEGFAHITKAQWDKCSSDYKGTTREVKSDTHGRHRVRSMLGVCAGIDGDWNAKHAYHLVFITDAKRVDPPTPEDSPPRPKIEAPVVEPAPVRLEGVHPGHETEAQRALRLMRATLKAGIQTVTVPQLFPTPAELAERMADEADIRPGHRILEPSAGTGNLLDQLPAGCEVVAVEINATLAGRLECEGRAIVCGDFLNCTPEALWGLFDRIIMNPPFAAAADIDHILHALRFLKPGGRLVALCAAGPRQHARLSTLGSWEVLPPGSFAEAGTNVNVALLVIDN